MQIQVIPRDCGGTEFIAQPHRLHLGRTERRGHRHPGVPAAGGVAGCAVTLHIKHCDGTLAVPIPLGTGGEVTVGRSFTGWAAGEWMLAATDGNGYAAYTRPGRYDVHGILPLWAPKRPPPPVCTSSLWHR